MSWSPPLIGPVLALHPRRAPAGPVAAHPPSRTVFLTASRIPVYSLHLLGGQRRDVIGERAGHDLGIEALEQRYGSEPLSLSGSLAASRLSLQRSDELLAPLVQETGYAQRRQPGNEIADLHCILLLRSDPYRRSYSGFFTFTQLRHRPLL